jgi:hypothetical protein
MQLLDEDYLFGKVILADMPRERAPMPGAKFDLCVRQMIQACEAQRSDVWADY